MTKHKQLIVTLSLTGLLFTGIAATPPLGSASWQDAKELYIQKCASCHAADGSGNTAKGKQLKARDQRSPEVQAMSDEELFEVIAKGKKKMPGYDKKLDKAKIQLLVAYTRELGGKK